MTAATISLDAGGGALRSVWLLVRWKVAELRGTLLLLAAVQTLLGAGTVIGLAFLLPHVDSASARYLTTGAPTFSLITIGLVVLPSQVASARQRGVFDFVYTLPVPRLAGLAADLTVWFAVMLPGMVASLVLASLRFGIGLHLTLALVPAVGLAAAASAAIGYAIAMVTPNPTTTSLITTAILVGTLLFSPVDFPVSRLPGWLQAAQRVLPVESMAQAVRGGLTGQGLAALGGPLLELVAWLVGALAVCGAVAGRRRR